VLGIAVLGDTCGCASTPRIPALLEACCGEPTWWSRTAPKLHWLKWDHISLAWQALPCSNPRELLLLVRSRKLYLED
jgi:hypothetical protein